MFLNKLVLSHPSFRSAPDLVIQFCHRIGRLGFRIVDRRQLEGVFRVKGGGDSESERGEQGGVCPEHEALGAVDDAIVDGTQTVTITATDSDLASTLTTFDLAVANVAPSVAADNATVTVAESETATNSGTFSDPGVDDVTLSASVGTVVDNGDGTFTYTPTAEYNGADSFTYTVSDGNGGTDSATVSIMAVSDASGSPLQLKCA